jgi:hypothetical protein
MSNFAKGMKRCGEIWLSMARDIYVEEKRKMKTVSPAGESGMVELMQPTIDDNGALITGNDMSRAVFEVVSEVGPSSKSERQRIVRDITGMLQITQDPETVQVLTATAMANMEGKGLSDTNAYFRKKLLRMGAAKPTEDEMKEMQAESQNQPPDPNALYLQAAAEEATAKAAQARANTVETIASAELKNAQTAQTLAKIGEVQTPVSEDAIKALERRKKEVEIEILQVDLVKKLRELEAPEPTEEEPEKEEEPNYEAQAALAIADAVDGLAESVQGVRSVVESMTASNNENAGKAIEAVRKPKRVIRENGRVVGIE